MKQLNQKNGTIINYFLNFAGRLKNTFKRAIIEKIPQINKNAEGTEDRIISINIDEEMRFGLHCYSSR